MAEGESSMAVTRSSPPALASHCQSHGIQLLKPNGSRIPLQHWHLKPLPCYPAVDPAGSLPPCSPPSQASSHQPSCCQTAVNKYAQICTNICLFQQVRQCLWLKCDTSWWQIKKWICLSKTKVCSRRETLIYFMKRQILSTACFIGCKP